GRCCASDRITWNARQWHLGPNFLRHDDPTGTVGSGDDDGHRFVGHVVSDLGGAQVAVDSPWSLHVRGSVRLPHAIDLGLALNGRSGYPLPYFRRVARGAGVARVELTERVDSIRAPDRITLDARLAKAIELGAFDLTFSLEAFNLQGDGEVLRRETDLGVGRGGLVHQFSAHREFRFGVRLSWR
ncbi:MAG: hypothetical protein AAF657_37555, partial [Acidobacteriota bacterium]